MCERAREVRRKKKQADQEIEGSEVHKGSRKKKKVNREID
jgi:hypothetical protein